MLYRVRAKAKLTELQRFWALLTDGTVANQEPDGLEIIASMKRAVLKGDRVEWSETCYCSPPLNHERTTIYDRFFSEIEIQPQISQARLEGEQFWRHLEQTFDETSNTGGGTMSTSLKHVPLRLL